MRYGGGTAIVDGDGDHRGGRDTASSSSLMGKSEKKNQRKELMQEVEMPIQSLRQLQLQSQAQLQALTHSQLSSQESAISQSEGGSGAASLGPPADARLALGHGAGFTLGSSPGLDASTGFDPSPDPCAFPLHGLLGEGASPDPCAFPLHGLLGEGARMGLTQRGVLRTNCVDCLDRTNVAQVGLGYLLVDLFVDIFIDHLSDGLTVRLSTYLSIYPSVCILRN